MSEQTDDLVEQLRHWADRRAIAAVIAAQSMTVDLLREAADEIDRLRAQAPPTAGEVLAHIARGDIEWFDWIGQTWSIVEATRCAWLIPVLDEVDPSTPQPGLRLVTQEEK